MCQILMNNEFRKITIIALSQVDVSKKYKMNTSACQLLYTGPFHDKAHQCVSTTYGHRKNTNTNYNSWCVCVILCIGAFMCDYSSVRLYDLWALHKYQYKLEQSLHLYDLWAVHKYKYELEQSVHLCDIAHRCVSIIL